MYIQRHMQYCIYAITMNEKETMNLESRVEYIGGFEGREGGQM